MEVTINGTVESIVPCTIEQLVQQKGLRGDGLVVEHNFTIVKQSQWAGTRIAEGDTLELLSFVGGG